MGCIKPLGRLIITQIRQSFSGRQSPEAFLADLSETRVDCVVLDVDMPGINGLDLQLRMKHIGARLPIVFLTGQGNIRMSVRAIKSGAVNFLTKPIDQEEIIAALRVAVAEGERDRLKGVNDGLASGSGRQSELATQLDSQKNLTSRAMAQVELLNHTRSLRRFAYKFEWFDVNGMQINNVLSAQIPDQIEGGESKFISGVAPTAACKDFRLKLIKID